MRSSNYPVEMSRLRNSTSVSVHGKKYCMVLDLPMQMMASLFAPLKFVKRHNHSLCTKAEPFTVKTVWNSTEFILFHSVTQPSINRHLQNIATRKSKDCTLQLPHRV